jgi:hypothetical protein
VRAVNQLLTVVALLATSACASMATLKPPAAEHHFVLNVAHVRDHVSGIVPQRKLEGLVAGTYTAIGEDAEGFYFACKSMCVIQLFLKDEIESYLMTGAMSQATLSDGHRFPRALSDGGLWLPKTGAQKGPRNFYVIKNSTGSGGDLGIVGAAVVTLTESSLAFIPYDSESTFIQSITVSNK